MKNFTQKFIGLFALVFMMSFTTNAQLIGDIYEGGYIFQINEDSTGLVADLQDLEGENFSWYNAIDGAASATSQGYEDWYLPSKVELILMYNTIGNGGALGNIGGFEDGRYWSTTEEPDDENAWFVDFNDGSSSWIERTWSDSQRVRGIRSITFGGGVNTEDEATGSDDSANIFLDLPEGWSMFGYTCLDSVDAVLGFSEITDKIEIVKDEWGLSYLPSWEFNAMGSLRFSEGYQIKMIEEVTDFKFCDVITQADVEAVQQQLNAANQTISELLAEGDWNYPPEGAWYWLKVEECIDGDANSCADAAEELVQYNSPNIEVPWEINECVNALEPHWENYIAGEYDCPQALAQHPELLAEFFGTTWFDECGVPNGDNACIDECGVVNGDNSSCTDCAGVVNGTSHDIGCGCIPAGFYCDGSEFPQIGDQHLGGYLFYIDETGQHGLVADLQDLGEMSFYSAVPAAENATSQGYDDWYLPSIAELELMNNNIGPESSEGNIGNFIYTDCINNMCDYWSSETAYVYNNQGYVHAKWYNFAYGGFSSTSQRHVSHSVRIIRAF